MSTPALQIVAPNPRKHHAAMFDLIGKVFPNNGYYASRDWCRDYYVNHSHYDWQASRIGLLGDELVSHYGVWGYDMRIGSAVVRAGGIGAVATHADYRKQGIMLQTAQAAVDAMRQRDYDMTLLFGIENFYHRFGYVRAWAETTYHVNLPDLPTTPPPAVRAFTPTVRADIDAFHNRENALITGSAVRPTFRKKGFTFLPEHGFRWFTPEGAMSGYVCVAPQGAKLICTECAGAADAVLQVVAHLARRFGCHEVEFSTLPYLSPVARSLRQGSGHMDLQYRRHGGAMAHLLNLQSALEKLCGEFSRRLAASPLAEWRGALRITDPRHTVTLVIDHGDVWLDPGVETAHAIAGGEEMVLLLLGSDAPEEIVASAGLRLAGDAARLLPTLFPAQYPGLHYHDRY